MKKSLLTFAIALTTIVSANAQTTTILSENFDEGKPSSAPSSETTVTLNSGDWKFKSVSVAKDQSNYRAKMSGNGYFILPVLDKPTGLTFDHRASGGGKKLTVEKSVDGGHTWVTIGEASPSSASSYGNSSFNIDESSTDGVLVKFTASSATIFVDNIKVTSRPSTGEGGGDNPGGDDPVNPGDGNEDENAEPVVNTGTGNIYYLSAAHGNDNNDGSFEHPWYNLQKAVNAMKPGDVVYLRGGTYYPTMTDSSGKTTVRLTANGTAESPYAIRNFPNEFPILNFKDQPKKQSIRGILLTGNYWIIEGLHITQAGDNGIKLEGSHNLIKRCTFSYNDDTGIQLGFGHNFKTSVEASYGVSVSSNDGSWCSYNDIVDCDSYLNCDSDNYGSDADGFACKMHNGKGNRFIRCRAWNNSDDGWDLYETDYPVYLYECWAWGSGRASDFGWVEASGSFQGNGNGIKLGGNGTGGSSKGKHEAWNCIAFNCNKTGSVKGFDQNSHGDGVKLVNCLAFGCGYDFMFEKSDKDCEYYNNVCFGKYEIKGGTNSNNAVSTSGGGKGGWDVIEKDFSMLDYNSLSEEDAKAARGADGSMPRGFARLVAGSKLIDRGLDLTHTAAADYSFLTQPITGTARDLGPYEFGYGMSDVMPQMIFSKETKISVKATAESVIFSTIASGTADVAIYTAAGAQVWQRNGIAVEADAEYTLPLPSRLDSGFYIVTLTNGNNKECNKICVK